jgi:hypothetical protein
MADYRTMCEAIGPLDFEAFCAGYYHHGLFIATHRPPAQDSAEACGVKLEGGGLRDRASHAA